MPKTIALPIRVDFKTLGIFDGHRIHRYTFPIGRADVYYLLDGSTFTFVEIKNGQAIAIGQLFRERRVPSIAAGNISPEMSLYTDPIEKKVKMNDYSDLIQKLPDQ